MNEVFYKKLGANLKQAREAKDYSLQYVGDRLGVARQTVFNWEQGTRTINADYLFDYCDAIGVDVNDVTANLRKYNKR